LVGTNFGGSGARVLVGGALAIGVTHADWAPDSALWFALPSGVGLGRILVVLQNAGQLTVSTATIGYAQCRPGTVQDGLNCADCPAARYSALNDSDVCTDCAPGTYSAARSEQCTACAPGTVSNGSLSACTACPVGTSQERAGQSKCVACGLGKYAAEEGATTCSGTSQ
jgi:hypothetical protein